MGEVNLYSYLIYYYLIQYVNFIIQHAYLVEYTRIWMMFSLWGAIFNGRSQLLQLIRFLLPNAIFELRIASCIIMRVCTYMDALKTNAYCTFWGVALDGRSQLLQTIKFTYA